MKRFCDTEAFGTEFKGDGVSIENRKAVAKLEAETENLDVGYATPVLWIGEEPLEIPDNRRVTETRLQGLQKKFTWSSADYELHYRAAMEENFHEGYA